MNGRQVIFFLIFACLLQCQQDLFDFVEPEVVSESPQDGGFNVPLDTSIRLVFSEVMDMSSVEENLSVGESGNGVAYYLNWHNAKEVEVVLLKGLKLHASYAINLAREARDINGNKFVRNYSLRFSTGGAQQDFFVTSHYPALFHFGYTNTQPKIEMVFNDWILEDQSFKDSVSFSPAIGGFFTAESNVLNFSPFRPLSENSTYNVTVQTSLLNTNHSSLREDYSFSFFTGTSNSNPTLVRITTSDIAGFASPLNAYSNHSEHLRRDLPLMFEFSTNMNRSTVEDAISFSPNVSGFFQWDSEALVQYVPADDLVWNTLYEIEIADTAFSADGVKLDEEYVFNLRTANPLNEPLHVEFVSNVDLVQSFDVDVLNEVKDNPTKVLNIRVGFDLELGNEIKQVSLIENVSFQYVLGPVNADAATIQDISYISPNLVINVSNFSLSNIYRLRLLGGGSGIVDVAGTSLDKTYEYQIKVVP